MSPTPDTRQRDRSRSRERDGATTTAGVGGGSGHHYNPNDPASAAAFAGGMRAQAIANLPALSAFATAGSVSSTSSSTTTTTTIQHHLLMCVWGMRPRKIHTHCPRHHHYEILLFLFVCVFAFNTFLV